MGCLGEHVIVLFWRGSNRALAFGSDHPARHPDGNTLQRSTDRGSPDLRPDRDCGDFDTWTQAQDFYVAAGGPDEDLHRLDGDRDGIACAILTGAP